MWQRPKVPLQSRRYPCPPANLPVNPPHGCCGAELVPHGLLPASHSTPPSALCHKLQRRSPNSPGGHCHRFHHKKGEWTRRTPGNQEAFPISGCFLTWDTCPSRQKPTVVTPAGKGIFKENVPGRKAPSLSCLVTHTGNVLRSQDHIPCLASTDTYLAHLPVARLTSSNLLLTEAAHGKLPRTSAAAFS